VETAVAESDVVLFLVDIEEGVHPADLEIAAYLRTANRPIVLVANKADRLPDETRHLAFYELGLGDPFPISAAIGKSSGDLLDRIVALLPPAADAEEAAVTQVAVVGRPNVGKSSLVNRLLGEERLVVAAEPGTTRDAIDTPLRWNDRTLVFIDTAGLRRRSKVQDDIEFYSTLRTARAIERADVCVLVVDAQVGMDTQDLKIATTAWEQGTGLIIAVNKWDLIEEKDSNTAVRGESEVMERAPSLEFVPFLYLSAKTGQRVPKLLELIVGVAAEREKRVPTAEVNRVLGALVDRQQPPQPVGESVRLLYASQIGTAPPRFAIVSNRPEAIPESYARYLVKGFREAWQFTGSPVNLKLRRRRETARR
jgi:GTP-binding protein